MIDRVPPGSGADTPRARQLIAAAYELLEAEGLEGLTIRAVLKRTGLARRAFYECFAGKDDLVLAVFEFTMRVAALNFEEQIRLLDDPLERMGAIVIGMVQGGLGLENDRIEMSDRRSAALSSEHLRLAESRPAKLQAALSPLLVLISWQVAEGIRQGQFRECDPDLQAMLIFNLIATTMHTELLARESGSLDKGRRRKLADEIWEFCRRAIIA